MIVHYLDPSAWIKRHFQEAGSDAVVELFRTLQTAACCRLGLVEMVATVARKSRGESLGESIVQQLLQNVKADFALFDVLPVDEPLIERATELAVRYGLRTIDAIHLAAALSRQQGTDTVVVVSSDQELLTAADQAGLAIYNPLTV